MSQSDLPISPDTWSSAIAIGSSAKFRVQNTGTSVLIVQAFPNSTAPAALAEAGGIHLAPGAAWAFEYANDFPGVASPTHYRLYSVGSYGKASLSYA